MVKHKTIKIESAHSFLLHENVMSFLSTKKIFFSSSTDTIRGKMFDVIFSPTRKVSKDVKRRIDEGKRIIAIKMFRSQVEFNKELI